MRCSSKKLHEVERTCELQVNLDKLWSLVSEQTRAYYADKKDKAPVTESVTALAGSVHLLFKLAGASNMSIA